MTIICRCMIHENTFYFSDDPEDTEPPRRLFGFSGCVVTLKGLELEVSAVCYIVSTCAADQCL